MVGRNQTSVELLGYRTPTSIGASPVKRLIAMSFAVLVTAACQDTPTGVASQEGQDGVSAVGAAPAYHVDSSLTFRTIFGFNDATVANGFPFRPYGTTWTNNPTCEDLGLVGLKVDNGGGTNVNGTHNVFVTVNGVSTLAGSVTVTGDGTTWDWTSTFGVDAVISKGGVDDDGGHIYVYDPDSYGDNGLFSGMNKEGNARQEISHVNFCFNLEADAAIDTDPYARKTYDWAIDKSTTQGDMSLNKGVGATVEYSIVATPSGPVESHWRLDGTVKLRNDFAFPIAIAPPTLLVNGVPVPPFTLNCPSLTIPAKVGNVEGVVICTFSMPLTNSNPGTVAFMATTVATEVDDISAQTTYAFAPGDYELFNATATVQDFFNGAAPFNFPDILSAEGGPVTLTYTGTIPASNVCDIQTIVNKAVLHTPINGSQGTLGADLQREDEASFVKKVIGCIGVNVTANTSFDRTYSWSIDKSATHSLVETASGQDPVNVTYSVTVTPSATDANWAVSGAVTVTNEALYPAVINVTGVVTCTTAVLPPNGTAQCTYNLANPNPNGGTVTASATVESSNPVTASATYAFSEPTLHGEQITVYDQFASEAEQVLGTPGSLVQPTTFNYVKSFGGTACGTTTYNNTSRFAGNNGQTGSDSWSLSHTITGCSTGTGCTLTQGYWKTHSVKGPAAHPDDTWNLVGPLAEDSPFYLSGKSWYQVFWTSPQGNAYYTLAHQFMAATLNQLNGASAPADVLAALADAQAFFAANVPVPPSGKYKGKDALQLNAMAQLLDAYNNGVGPGHCSENPII